MKKKLRWIVIFWLDYAVSGYNRLKKYDNDPEIDIILNTSFIQSLNINLIFVFLFKVIDFKVSDFKYMLITTLLLVIINYLCYNKLDDKEKKSLKERIPKFENYVYRLYALISAILLFICAYFLSGT